MLLQVSALLRAEADPQATPALLGPELAGTRSKFLADELQEVRLSARTTERHASVHAGKRRENERVDQRTGNDYQLARVPERRGG